MPAGTQGPKEEAGADELESSFRSQNSLLGGFNTTAGDLGAFPELPNKPECLSELNSCLEPAHRTSLPFLELCVP